MKNRRILALCIVLAMMVGMLCIGVSAADEMPAMPEGGMGAPPEGMGAPPEGMGAPPEGGMPGGDMGGMGAPPEGGMGGMGGPGGMPGAAAATGVKSVTEFADYADITNPEVVDMMIGLGIINGEPVGDGYEFQPNALIERAAMAKMISTSLKLLGFPTDMEPQNAPVFTDIEGSWAADYINECAGFGIINGNGDGTFNPAGNVTASETAKMLLAAQDYDVQMTGEGWEENVIAAAEAAGFFKDVKGEKTAAITRGDAAQMIYNAIFGTGEVAPGEPVGTVQVTEDMSFDALTLDAQSIFVAPNGKVVTMLVGGVETEIEAGTYADVKLVLTDDIGDIASEANRGKEDYRTALYIDGTGLVESKSVTEAISAGTYDGKTASDVVILSKSDNFDGIIVNDADYEIKNLNLTLDSKADGSNNSDFTGYGAAVAAFGDSKVTISDSNITTNGVARVALYSDDGADVLFQNSEFTVNGGTLYEGYKNTANTAVMVAPPWVLGIAGNARGTNLLGNYSTTTLYNCIANADGWGVLSTDGCSKVVLTVIDSEVNITGVTGYGTYVIGDAIENFYGTTFNVATYAVICREGTANFASSNGTFDVTERSDAAEVVFSGLVGAGKATTVNSKAFGVMTHATGGNINVTDGTVFNTENAAFLIKSTFANIVVDNATLNCKDGVILQVMDDDDSIVGMGDMANMAFNTEFKEAEGYPGIDYASEGKAANGEPVNATFTNVTLNGDMFNGSGYLANARVMNVTLGEGCTLTGAISSTSTIHSTDGGATQNTYFTIDEYFKLGHVVNKAYSNGANTVNVTVSEGAAWTVDGECVISSLTVEDGAVINGTMTVDGAATPIAAGTYTGSIVLNPAA